MALAIDSASIRPMNAIASAPCDSSPSVLTCTSGIWNSGRLAGILPEIFTSVCPVPSGTVQP
ncbi:Uncharacterised protein [Mycobacteroides abscessus subsp. abscessus]|nr:Uncharacterised protein [Mycobacteroides abscessus subsp. abscessus]